MSLSDLMSIWRARDVGEWSHSPETYRALAEKLLAQGEPLLAYDVVTEALGKWRQDVRLRQLQGLALARSGATERANVILEQLRREGQTDEETLGILGRTYKDLASRSASRSKRKEFLRRAVEIYRQAYESCGGYWSGINAATTSLLIGETECARALAKKVRKECEQALSGGQGDTYWVLAALGESALILRDWTAAERCYAQAAREAGRRCADLNSSRRNARLIFKYWKQDAIELESCLGVPPVIVFSGHMIDAPDRAAPRFPPELESTVAQALRDWIDEVKPGFGFASAACGSDILFLEAMLEAGAEVSIVLPYKKEEFIRDSVDFLPASDWRARFERVVDRAANCITASTQKLEHGSISHDFNNELVLGLATIHAQRLETSVIPLAVWDGDSGDGPGGTASALRNWHGHGYTPKIVSLPRVDHGLTKRSRGNRSQGKSLRRRSAGGFTARVVSILFADAVGFSKLDEDEVPRFVQHFLGAIARLTGKFRKQVIAKNTWGDGLYFVLSDIEAAGKFALALADLIASTNWQGKGLRSNLNLRIALHAGPVYEFDDPVTGNRSYSGTHVSRAARIEPITPPGQVYASEAFAALAAARGAESFTCDYVGQTALAKEYGTLPMYHVRWRSRAVRF